MARAIKRHSMSRRLQHAPNLQSSHLPHEHARVDPTEHDGEGDSGGKHPQNQSLRFAVSRLSD